MRFRLFRNRDNKAAYNVEFNGRIVGQVIAEPPHGHFHYEGEGGVTGDYPQLINLEDELRQWAKDGRFNEA